MNTGPRACALSELAIAMTLSLVALGLPGVSLATRALPALSELALTVLPGTGPPHATALTRGAATLSGTLGHG
jgi:hypothetical protein